MSTMTIEEFHHDLIQDIRAAASANENFHEAEFTQSIANDLADAGVTEGFELCHYRAPAGGIRVDGYSFGETSLDLFITDFENRETLESLTQTEIASILKRVENFFVQSASKNLAASLEETSPAWDLASEIAARKDEISRINCFLLSERRLSDRVKVLEDKRIDGRVFSYSVWDISRLHRMHTATGAREELVIDFTEINGRGLPCLPAHIETAPYKSYLVVMPASVLADLYEKYGARLLEQNVRSFLQIRTGVNKGIRATIIQNPEMFFAYNNGITATAKDVQVANHSNAAVITRLTDLQIVNGGQTTASLYNARRNDRAKLDGIFVQMKLSVIDDGQSEEVVPKISEYANTQNKVSAADFFSNHPFHIRMQDASRRIWAPAQQGMQRETKWFYERARGQYLDEQSKRTAGEKKRFLAEYPKTQMFNKTDLAKFENVWGSEPHVVHMGAQKNFAFYAQRIGQEWEKREQEFNDLYFRRAVARGILFRHTEKLVSAQPWYNGGYRANVVAYTLSVLAEICRRQRRFLDTKKIWDAQSISPTLTETVRIIAKYVHDSITNPTGKISNITEWCKREACWNQLKSGIGALEQQLPAKFFDTLMDREASEDQQRAAAKTRKIQNGVEAQKMVFSVPAATWANILAEGKKLDLFSLKEIEILQLAARIPEKIPTEKQCAVLLNILDTAREEAIYAD